MENPYSFQRPTADCESGNLHRKSHAVSDHWDVFVNMSKISFLFHRVIKEGELFPMIKKKSMSLLDFVINYYSIGSSQSYSLIVYFGLSSIEVVTDG